MNIHEAAQKVIFAWIQSPERILENAKGPLSASRLCHNRSILVQILRYWVKDTSSLHLLRFYLYQSHNWNSLITPKKSSSFFSKRNKRFFFFLYNSHVRESESIFVFLCNQSSHLRSIPYTSEFFANSILFLWKNRTSYRSVC